MSASVVLDLSWPRERWSLELEEAQRRGSFRGAVRSVPHLSIRELAWRVLLLAASGQG